MNGWDQKYKSDLKHSVCVRWGLGDFQVAVPKPKIKKIIVLETETDRTLTQTD